MPVNNSDHLDLSGFLVRAIGGQGRGQVDHVTECLICGALVTYDSGVMQRHIEWHKANDQ